MLSSSSYSLRKYLEMEQDETVEVDLYNDIDSMSHSSTKQCLTRIRRLTIAKVNLFRNVVNDKAANCHNKKKISDTIDFLGKLEKLYEQFDLKVKSNEITHLEKPDKYYVTEMLKDTRYENQTETVDKSKLQIISGIMNVFRESIDVKINLLDSESKIELSVTWIEIKMIEFLEFMQQ